MRDRAWNPLTPMTPHRYVYDFLFPICGVFLTGLCDSRYQYNSLCFRKCQRFLTSLHILGPCCLYRTNDWDDANPSTWDTHASTPQYQVTYHAYIFINEI